MCRLKLVSAHANNSSEDLLISLNLQPFIASLHILNLHQQTVCQVELGFLCCQSLYVSQSLYGIIMAYVPGCLHIAALLFSSIFNN
jgi:hypothetical protein